MAMATDSPFTSPLSYLENPSPSPPRLEIATKVAEPPLPAIVGWSVRADPPPPSTEARSEEGGSRFVDAIVRRDRAAAIVRRAAIVARVSAAILCLISFSVMAADKDKGWALDSFDHYNEYRYCVTVNVFGFVYAAFQAVAEVHHMVNKKHIITKPMGFYFDFAMDQIMAYLLISASSSATSRTDYWVTNWGTDPFPSMISGSVAVSFLAFVAFAISSLISAYNLFSSRTL